VGDGTAGAQGSSRWRCQLISAAGRCLRSRSCSEKCRLQRPGPEADAMAVPELSPLPRSARRIGSGPMQPLRGISLKIASVVVFVTMAALIKAAANQGVPPGQAVFFRSLFAIPPTLAWLAVTGDLRRGLHTR